MDNEDLLNRLAGAKGECVEWIGQVAANGAVSGAAAERVRQLFDGLSEAASALRSSGEAVAFTKDNGPGKVVGLEWNPSYPVHVLRRRIPLYLHPATPEQPGSADELAAWHELADHVRIGFTEGIWPGRYTDAAVQLVAQRLRDTSGSAVQREVALRAHLKKIAEDCATCNGVGMIGGSSGQTPDNFQQDAEPCPDCTQPEARGVEGVVLVPVEPTPEMLSAAAFATSSIATGKWSDMAVACYRAMLASAPAAPGAAVGVDDAGGNHKLDTDTQVFFYEQDFYVLSNFSAFTLQWKGRRFDTSEAAYHWEKFPDAPEVQDMLIEAPSAHVAFKIAESQKVFRRPDWDDVKLDVMREVLRAKAAQHEYVRRKLLTTGTRELVEDSWRDDFWGWGPNKDGHNWLGRLWMEVRAELTAALAGKNGAK